jgi:PAS domain S-box-containing protein
VLQGQALVPGLAPAERTLRIHALVVELLGELLRAPLEQTDAVIDAALGRLGGFCNVDRVYVFCRRETPAGAVVDNTHEWVAAGIEPAMHLSRDLPETVVAPLLPQLAADAPVEIGDVAALPESSPLRAHLLIQDIRSLLLVPMRDGDRLAGFVGFDAVRAHRVFPAEEVLLLKSVADAIANVLQRREAAARIAETQDSLMRARNRLKATLDAMPEIVLEVDAEGRFADVHTADASQLLRPADQIIGRTHEEALPPDLAALGRRVMAEVNADPAGRSALHHYTMDTPKGRRAFALSAARRPPEGPGGAPGYVFVVRDVTEAQRLTAEAERLGLIARRMTDLVMIIGTDNRIEWVNPAFEARTGWSLDEVRGVRPPDLLHCPETDPATVARVHAAMAAGRPVQAEMVSRTRSGERFWTEIDLHPLHDATGRLSGYVSVETDITERRRQQETLAQLAHEATEARARLEMAVEALPDAFAYYDADDRLVLCNARYRDFYPRTGSRMTPGTPFAEIVRSAIANGEVPAATGREEEWLAERLERHRAADGTAEQRQAAGRWLRVIERSTPDGGRVGMRIDITGIKLAEQRLTEIIDGAEAGTWEWDVTTGENRVNARWAAMIGYTLEDLGTVTIERWRSLLHPDDRAAAETRLAPVLTGEADRFETEIRMLHKAGHWVWIQTRGRVARRDAQGSPELMAGVHLDISPLKHAEERLEQIIDAAAAGTWERDLTTGAAQINDRWAAMLGYDRAELEGLTGCGFDMLTHPEDLCALRRQNDSTLAAGQESFGNEIRMRHKAGHWVWVLSRGRVIARDAEGRPARVAGIHLDISERKRLEEELTAERDYLARLMETSESCITALDADGRLIFANRAAETVLGLASSELAGRCYDDPAWRITALDGGEFPHSALPFVRVMATGQPVRDVRHAIEWPDGRRCILSVNAAPLRARGLSARVVCAITDITEQVAAEAELRDAALRAEAANRAKSRFLANMSHEIRTPLNGVLGMAQLLEDEIADPRQRGLLATIRDSGEMLLAVLNDILDVSKIEAGKLELETVPFLPVDLLRRIEAMHAPQAAARGLALTVRAGRGSERVRLGDPNRLAQVLHNLVGNAVKFTETGGVAVLVSAPGDGALHITVRDSGIGMSPSQLARIFEDFEQADGSVTRRFGGTGLGMSIVRRLVGLMGGRIALHSRPGQGTAVRIRLPLPRAPEGLMPVAAGGATGAVVPAGGIAGLRALAADDNATNRIILQAMLTRLGIAVTMAVDGQDAVAAWAPGKADLLLLDISMPGMDGVETLAAIRAREAAAGVAPAPAIAITANAMSHQVAEYLGAGFAAHVGKPFRREDLAAAIAALGLTPPAATDKPARQAAAPR